MVPNAEKHNLRLQRQKEHQKQQTLETLFEQLPKGYEKDSVQDKIKKSRLT